MVREVVQRHVAGVTPLQRTEHRILELTQVAWPVSAHEHLERLRREPTTRTRAMSLDERTDNVWYVVSSGIQRRRGGPAPPPGSGWSAPARACRYPADRRRAAAAATDRLDQPRA